MYVIGTRAEATSSRQTSLVRSLLPSLTRMISWPPSIGRASISRTTAEMVSALSYSGITNERAGVMLVNGPIHGRGPRGAIDGTDVHRPHGALTNVLPCTRATEGPAGPIGRSRHPLLESDG